MVTDLSGDVWMQKGDKQKRLNVLSYIEEGGSIHLDAKAAISITTFMPAAEYAVVGPAKLELVGGAVRVLNGGKLTKVVLDEQTVRAGKQFSAVQRERLTMAALRMRGGGADGFGLSQLSPVNVEMLNVRPNFSWSAPREAKRFSLTLIDETTGKVIQEVSLNEPTWKMSGEPSLQYQHQYSWKVRAQMVAGQEMISTAEFTVVDEARAKRILQSKPAVSAPFSDRVLYAVLLESEGLNTDAVDEWKVLAAERPNEPLITMHLKNH